MKLLQLMLSLCLVTAVAHGQAPSGDNEPGGAVLNQDGQARLQLTTNIVNQYYEGNFAFLRWTLRLTYTNVGDQPILLDKKSSLIYRSMVSRSLRAAAAKKYEEETRSSFITAESMKAAGFRFDSVPMEDAFVALKPGESWSLETEYGARVYDGTKDSEDFLRSGIHFLQVRVATWYYLSEPGKYREQWRDKGYLWSQNVTSTPMSFTVEKKQGISKSKSK